MMQRMILTVLTGLLMASVALADGNKVGVNPTVFQKAKPCLEQYCPPEPVSVETKDQKFAKQEGQESGSAMIVQNRDRQKLPVVVTNIANCLMAARDRETPESRQPACTAAQTEAEALYKELFCDFRVRTSSDGQEVKMQPFKELLKQSLASALTRKADQQGSSIAFEVLKHYCETTGSCFERVLTAEEAAKLTAEDEVEDEETFTAEFAGFEVESNFELNEQEVRLIALIAAKVTRELGTNIQQVVLWAIPREGRCEHDFFRRDEHERPIQNRMQQLVVVLNNTSGTYAFTRTLGSCGAYFGSINPDGKDYISRAIHEAMTKALEFQKEVKECAQWQADDGYQPKDNIKCQQSVNYAELATEEILEAPLIYEPHRRASW